MCIFHLGTASFSCHRVLGALCRLFSYSVPIQPLSCLMADEQGCQISKKPPFHFLVYLFQEYKPVTCWPFVHIRPNGSSIRTKLKLSKQVFSLILSCDNPACLPSPRWCVKVTRALGCRLIQHFVSLGWSLGRQICPGKKFARLLQQPSSVSLLSLSRSLCLSLSLSLSLCFSYHWSPSFGLSEEGENFEVRCQELVGVDVANQDGLISMTDMYLHRCLDRFNSSQNISFDTRQEHNGKNTCTKVVYNFNVSICHTFPRRIRPRNLWNALQRVTDPDWRWNRAFQTYGERRWLLSFAWHMFDVEVWLSDFSFQGTQVRLIYQFCAMRKAGVKFGNLILNMSARDIKFVFCIRPTATPGPTPSRTTRRNLIGTIGQEL
jgi:hypothetical protein